MNVFRSFIGLIKVKPVIGLLMGAILFSCSQLERHAIVCDFKGIDSDTCLVGFFPYSMPDTIIKDTFYISNGHLIIDFEPDGLNRVVILPYKFLKTKMSIFGRRISFFIDRGEKIRIKARLVDDNYLDYEVDGNLLSEQSSEYRKNTIKLIGRRTRLDDEFYAKPDSLVTDEETDAYFAKRYEITNEFKEVDIQFVIRHPDYIYSAKVLQGMRDKEKITELYDQLTDDVKSSYFGTVIGDMVKGWQMTIPGATFPDINDKTVFGKDFSLYGSGAEYILIDFWGTWCGPCLSEMSDLNRLYKKYENKLLIVGIACNDTKSQVLESIAEHDLEYPQILEGRTGEKKYSQKFGIVSFPTKLLLDKKGIVIKKYNGVDKNLYSDISRLFEN